jgi:pyruvate/2-oxoglutarate dehydrogenase complex dihydrolipoamide dehydrogenase (E3) component
MEKFDIIVIGAGAAGLVVAAGASSAGKKVLLIEKENWGGDCTNFGCVPSKSLIASAAASHIASTSKTLGLETCTFAKTEHALERVRKIVSSIREHEEPEALQKKGITTMTGSASFIDANTIRVQTQNEQQVDVTGKFIVIAAGSHPRIPEIPGLAATPFLTNETIFSLEKIPQSLVVLGGGPIGCELGQAFQRLGSEVTLIHSHSHLLEREEEDAQELLKDKFSSEGIKLFLDAKVQSVEYSQGQFTLTCTSNGKTDRISSTQLLVSIGRVPNTKNLNLENAKIVYSAKGIQVDRYGRTSVPNVFAIGDVTGPPFFTHRAEHEARAVLTTLLTTFFTTSLFSLSFKMKINSQAMPRVTYTSPEIASVGLSAKEAEAEFGKDKIAIYTFPLEKVDRAITTSQTTGFFKVVTKKWSSRILGATIVAPNGGDMLPILSLAMYKKIPLRKLTNLIFPYPTYALGIRQTADLWLKEVVIKTVKSWFKK